MALVIESQSVGGPATGGSLDVTKPTGLAVGDLLVGVVYDSAVGGSGGIDKPTGFTLIASLAAGNSNINASYKIADSSDVAASSFNFPNTSTQHYGAILFRVSGHDPAAPIGAFNSGTTTNNDSGGGAIGITPARSNSLLFICTTASTSVTALAGYAIATSNPSWTEQTDITLDHAGTNVRGAVATATRPEVTATGNVTITGGSGGVTDWNTVFFSVQMPADVTVSAGVQSLVSSVQAPEVRTGSTLAIGVQSITSSVNSVTVDVEDNPWENQAKSGGTSVVNQAKS